MKSNLEITLGKDENNLVYTDSLYDICHILIGGSTDIEKDRLISSIVKDLVYFNEQNSFKIAFCDFTRKDYSFIPPKHLYRYPLCKDVNSSMDLINELCGLVKERSLFLQKSNYTSIQTYNEANQKNIDAVILIINEYSRIIEKFKEEFISKICYILERGRACSVFVILATKEMNKKVVTPQIESLFPSKICFDTITAYESRVIVENNMATNLLENEFIYQTSSRTDYEKLKLL